MSRRQFRNFLSDLKEIIHPNPGASIEPPVSPPDWEQLGWKVGWIVEEGHGGLQFLLTDEESWSALTRDFGRERSQKSQVFADRYSGRIERLAKELGKPVKLKSLKWRQMDCSAFEDKQMIEEEQWWQVTIGDNRLGEWHFLFTGRFYQLFEIEDDEPTAPEPPWSFTELWHKLGDNARRPLLEKLGHDRGNLNHLSGLIAAGVIDRDEAFEGLPRTPAEELEDLLKERQEILRNQSGKARKQTQNQWKINANDALVDVVGEWIEQGALSGAGWSDPKDEWQNYRKELYEFAYDTERWMEKWKQLDESILRQLVPRLDYESLQKASVQLPDSIRNAIREQLNDRRRQSFGGAGEQAASEREVYEARARIDQQARSILDNLDVEIPEKWSCDPLEKFS